MSRPSQFTDPAAEEQASLWAARLEGSTLTAADRAALDAWMSANPAHRSLLSKYCQFSVGLKDRLPEMAEAGSIPVPDEILLGRGRWQPRWIAAAALAAAALVVFALWLGLPGGRPEMIATTAGQRRTVVLNDGSRVELNARSSLFVENSRSERRVRLDDGEAFFVVSKDRSRPFIVTTPAGTVRVTGTIFDVRSETSSELVVTVVEVSVLVRPGGGDGGQPPAVVSLAANDRLSWGPAGTSVQALSRTAVRNSLEWRRGFIVFDGTPVREAVARFARYNGCDIAVTDGAANLHLSARVNLDDLEGFLATLKDFLPVRAIRLANGAIRVSLRDEN